MTINPKNGQVVRDNLAGMKAGNCIVHPRFEKQADGGTKWLVECQCPAKTRWMAWSKIIKQSPGLCCKACRNAILSKKRTTHGETLTRRYRAWQNMLARCYVKTHKSYADYGGRGITVCKRWRKYENFKSDMGERPPGFSIHRKNNNGNYEPSNCEWADQDTQANKKRTSKTITYNGETHTYSQWSRITGISKNVIRVRANKGWPPEKILAKVDYRVDKYNPPS